MATVTAVAVAFFAGFMLGLWLCDREVKAAQECAAREHRRAQVAHDALAMALGGDPCKLPPNC